MMNSNDYHPNKRPKYVENPTIPGYTLSEAFIAQQHQQHDAYEQYNNPNSYYNKQHAADRRECTLVLANKVISDLNTLVQYLESSDPILLKESHLGAAQHLVTSFVMRVQSMQQPSLPNHAPPTSPLVNSGQHYKMFPPPPFIGSPYDNRKPINDINDNRVNAQQQQQQVSQQQQQLGYATSPTNPSVGLSMFKPFQKYSPPGPPPVAAPAPPLVSFSVNTRLDDFDLLEILGTGTFGKVRLCRHKATKKHYCMKILNKSRIVRLKQTEHIKNEKEVLKSISHPFIVKLFGTFKDKTSLFLLLEFIPGGELFNYIRRAGRLPNYTAKVYAAEIVLALEHLHSKDILYRDLKPENLLIDEYGHIKLTDFGFSKYVRDRTMSMCGTPEYIAPEIILSKGHGKAVDWWSLGILIFEMLAGYPPFSDEANKTIFEKILTERAEIPEYFDPLARDLIEKLLVVDSSRRLGCLKGTVADIKNHPWFGEIDWVGLINHTVPGPLNPGVTKDGDTHNFYKYSDVNLNEELDENVDYEALFADF